MQQAKFTISPIVEEHKFHFHAIKTHLTPSLERKINDLLEEVALAFQQEVGTPTGMYIYTRTFWRVTLLSQARLESYPRGQGGSSHRHPHRQQAARRGAAVPQRGIPRHVHALRN